MAYRDVESGSIGPGASGASHTLAHTHAGAAGGAAAHASTPIAGTDRHSHGVGHAASVADARRVVDDARKPGAGGDSFSAALSHTLTHTLRRPDARRIFIFGCILAAFTCIQGVYAIQIDSLGLMSDAFHMGFHVAGMFISLLGMSVSTRTHTFAYSYGYERYEVLAAFSNALFLLFLVAYVLAGAAQRLVEPGNFSATEPYILAFGVCSLGINVAGLVALRDSAGRGAISAAMAGDDFTGGGARGGRGKGATAHASNIQSVYLHFFTDAMSSCAVIVSSLMIRYLGLAIADTLQAVVVATITFYVAWPMFKSTGLILLQTVPLNMRPALERCRREVSIIDGVLEVADEHYWTQAPGTVVGSIVVRARSDAAEQDVLARVQRIYARVISELTVQVEKDAPLGWLHDDHARVPDRHDHEHHGHSHGAHDDHHGHSHGAHDDHHGHSHGSHDDHHGHSHGSHDDHHGHSHGSHDDHHGHSHAGSSHAGVSAADTRSPWEQPPMSTSHAQQRSLSSGHGHSHGDGHGHSHGQQHGLAVQSLRRDQSHGQDESAPAQYDTSHGHSAAHDEHGHSHSHDDAHGHSHGNYDDHHGHSHGLGQPRARVAAGAAPAARSGWW